ncbi:MAG: trimethylamine methyltransferase family protein [Candidatus Jordarchaeales archaeon]
MPKTGVPLPPKSRLWRVLDREELEIIDNAAYKILKDVGVFIDDKEMLKMAEEMGCSVNYETKLVTDVPEHVVREQVRKAPRSFLLAGREPEWDVEVEGPARRQYWAPESGATDVLVWDEKSKKYYRRRASSKDTLYAAKIVDGIDDFDVNVYIYDAAEEGHQGLPSELNKMNAMFQGTTKWAGHLCTTVSTIEEYDYVERLAAIVAGGEEELRKRPLFWTVYNYIGTLQLNRFNSWLFRASVKYHWPIMPAVTAAAPLMGPAMAAGNTAISHAGILFLTALKQFHDPGAAVVPNNIVFSLDPMTGRGGAHVPHFMLGTCAMNQLWHELYGLPTAQYGGTFAASLDQQAFNLARYLTLQIISGTDFIFEQCGGEAFDPALIPICAEIARMGRTLMSTFHQIYPTPENLALDVIKEVGAKGERWMTHKYNLDRLNMFPRGFCLDTDAFDTWLNKGARSWVYDLCREKLKELEKHEPKPLPKDVVERMNAIVKEGNEKLRVRVG